MSYCKCNGSERKMEIFTTRCLSLSQVILVAHSDSFPSSIWLMGAGEIEQGIVPPLQCFHTAPTHSIPRCSLLSWQDTKKEMRYFRNQTYPNEPTTAIPAALHSIAKSRKNVAFLECLLCVKSYTCTLSL